MSGERPATASVCAACGATPPPGARFCHMCGHPLDFGAPVAPLAATTVSAPAETTGATAAVDGTSEAAGTSSGTAGGTWQAPAPTGASATGGQAALPAGAAPAGRLELPAESADARVPASAAGVASATSASVAEVAGAAASASVAEVANTTVAAPPAEASAAAAPEAADGAPDLADSAASGPGGTASDADRRDAATPAPALAETIPAPGEATRRRGPAHLADLLAADPSPADDLLNLIEKLLVLPVPGHGRPAPNGAGSATPSAEPASNGQRPAGIGALPAPLAPDAPLPSIATPAAPAQAPVPTPAEHQAPAAAGPAASGPPQAPAPSDGAPATAPGRDAVAPPAALDGAAPTTSGREAVAAPSTPAGDGAPPLAALAVPAPPLVAPPTPDEEAAPAGAGRAPPPGGLEPAAGRAPVPAPVPLLDRLHMSWRADRLGWALFALSLLVYAVTRLVALEDFPIYFFSDEAIHPVQGAELVSRGFRDQQGTLFPPYFQNGTYWNLSLSVYLHGLTATLFGKSIFVTRATSAVVTLFGALAVGLILKLIFRARLWWAAAAVLTVTPAWFIHSRTAFEVALMVGFFAWFLLCYLLYRYRSPRFIYPAILFAAATLYAYANGQAIIGAATILLLLSDWRYHWRHWRTLAVALPLVALVAVPYLRFRLDHPTEFYAHLRTLDSYLLKPLPLPEKVAGFVQRMGVGLSPGFWYQNQPPELIRHAWKGTGHLQPLVAPFLALGLGVAAWRVRESAYRTTLLACLAAPVGAATAEVGITRVLALIVPAAILTALGLDLLLGLLRAPRARLAATLACCVALNVGGLSMLRDALVDGPTWYTDYGLYGMQWGTRQIFDLVPAYLRADPRTRVFISPGYTNGADIFLRFFAPNEARVQTTSVSFYLDNYRPFDPNTVFVMTPEEHRAALASDKLKPFTPERAIPFPNGAPGFVFARVSYVDDAAARFEAERAARRVLQTTQLMIDGQLATVAYSWLGAGSPNLMFDGDDFTLVRFLEANPAVVEVRFPAPRHLDGLAMHLGSMDGAVTVQLYADANGAPTAAYTQEFRNLTVEPQPEFTFPDAPPLVQKVRIEVRDLNRAGEAQIHIREIRFR